jgi:hypothetical protein
MNEESLKQLKEKCLSLNLPTYGTKSVLKKRIEDATASKTSKRKAPEAETEHQNNNNDNNESTSAQDTSFSKMKVEELKQKCKRLKLATYGTKKDLVTRLHKRKESVDDQSEEVEIEQQTDSFIIREAPEFIEEIINNCAIDPTEKPEKKSRGTGLDYIVDLEDQETIKEYVSIDEANQKIGEEDTWKKGNAYSSKIGKKQHYNCNKSTMCPAKLYTIEYKEDNKVHIFRSICPHEHHDVSLETKPKRGILSHVKSQIEYLHERKIKAPKLVQQTLLKNKLNIDEIPTRDQIKNYVYQYRNKKFGNA